MPNAHRLFTRAAGAALTIAALAATVAATYAADDDKGPSDPCLKQVYDLADSAEANQLPIATMEKLDGMFTSMEKHCKAHELPQAQAMAAQIKKLIDTEK